MASAAGAAAATAGMLAAVLAAPAPAAALVNKADDLVYDLGRLAAFDAHPVDPAALAADCEAALTAAARDNAQLLFKHIFELPVEKTEIGPVAVLPAPTTRLPRALPVPKPKPLTRWQKFALAKGIQKKKKGSMVWDEESQSWKPRWGYKRGNDKSGAQEWAIEVKEGDDPAADLFERKALETKARTVKNKLNQVKNAERAARATERRTGADGALVADPAAARPAKKARRAYVSDGSAAAGAAPLVTVTPVELAMAAASKGSARPAGIPSISASEGRVDGPTGQGKGPRPKPSGGKAAVAERLKAAQTSTASLGKFDKVLPGEPARPKDPRKHVRLPNEALDAERKRNSSVLKHVLGSLADGPAKGKAAGSGAGASAASRPAAKQAAGVARKGGKSDRTTGQKRKQR